MCAEVLIRHGADKLQRDEKGRIPYDYIGMKNSDYIWNAKGTDPAAEKDQGPDDQGGKSKADFVKKTSTQQKLAAKVFDVETQRAAEKKAFLEDDETFMRELLKPTEEDYVFLRKKQRENELKPVQLWASSLEETCFVQDLAQPPFFFAVTAERAVILKGGNSPSEFNGQIVKATPGQIWQQIGMEPVYGEPLCHWVQLTNGMPGVKGWTLWDRRKWHHEATRLGIHTGDKNSSKTLHKEMSMAFVNMTLASAQQQDAWKSVADLMPVQIFNSALRRIVQPRSAVPLRARSGPTLADCCIVPGPPFKVGESVLCAGQVVLDGGWVFYQVKRRHYGELSREKPGNGWLCARAKDYVSVVLKT
eukprot:g588.t1